MTKDNWLQVATIVAAMMMAVTTLVAPALAVYVQVRMTKPKATPTSTQEKTLSTREKTLSWRIGFLFGKYSGWALIFGVLTSLLVLSIVFWRFPAGRTSIVLISLMVNMISLQIGGFISFHIYVWVYGEFGKQVDFMHDVITKTQEQLLEHITLHNVAAENTSHLPRR